MIVFCHLYNDCSGSPVILSQVIAALKSANCRIMLLVGSHGNGVLDSAGVETKKFWYRRSGIRGATIFSYLLSQLCLYRLLSRLSIERGSTIYINTLLPFGGAIWGRIHRMKVVYHLHEVSIRPFIFRWFLVNVVNICADTVFYVSEDHKERLPVSVPKARVLDNPVPDAIARVGFATPYISRRTGMFQVLMLASLRDFKGVPEFLDLAHSMQGYPDIQFKLICNADTDEISQYFNGKAKPENLIVCGRTERPGVYYAAADILLNLSRVDMWIETVGLTVIEGMSFGLPVIVPPVGGPSRIVRDTVDGYLVDSRDIQGLASAVFAIYIDPVKALKMSEAARTQARKRSFVDFQEKVKAELFAKV